jgi:hypothetical protein
MRKVFTLIEMSSRRGLPDDEAWASARAAHRGGAVTPDRHATHVHVAACDPNATTASPPLPRTVSCARLAANLLCVRMFCG